MYNQNFRLVFKVKCLLILLNMVAFYLEIFKILRKTCNFIFFKEWHLAMTCQEFRLIIEKFPQWTEIIATKGLFLVLFNLLLFTCHLSVYGRTS